MTRPRTRPWSFARKKDISEKKALQVVPDKIAKPLYSFFRNSSITQLCGGAILISHKLRYPHAVLITLDFAGEIAERGHEGGHGHCRDVVNVLKDASCGNKKFTEERPTEELQMSAIENISFDHTQLLRFITAGSVDDGKSTLIGRLLHDSKSIFEDQLSAITHTSTPPRDGRCRSIAAYRRPAGGA